MNLPVGSKVQLAPYPDDLSEGIYLNIVGIAEPVDTLAEYWMGSALYFNIQNYGDNPLIPFYVTERAFFDGMGARYPWLVGDYEWFIFVDSGVITVDSVQSARDDLNGLEGDINKQIPRSTVLTLLENSRVDRAARHLPARPDPGPRSRVPVPVHGLPGRVVFPHRGGWPPGADP